MKDLQGHGRNLSLRTWQSN